MTGFNSSLLAKLSRLRQLVSTIVILVGALVLSGWLFDIYELKGAYGDITMKANAALSLLLAGASLWTLNLDGRNLLARRVGQVCAAIVTLVGVLTLSQHIFGWNLGLDQLLFTEPPGALGTTSPGRMGPPASTCFTLSGIALLLLHARRAVSLAQVLSIFVSLWALLAILGYTYQAKELYGVARYTGIALVTALSFFLLSLGLLAARADQGIVSVISSDRAGSLMARRLLIAAIGVPFLLGWLRLLGERTGYYDLGFGTALLVLAIIIIFTSLIWQSAASMNRAGEKLREREAELEEAQRIGNFGNWYWDAQTDVVTGSDELLRIYGLDPARDTLPNFAAQDGLFHPHESWQRINAAAQQALATGIGYELDVQAFRNGTPIWITTRSEVGRDADGKIVGLRGTVQDITARKQAEEAVRQSAAQLALIADTAPVFIAHCDAEARYKFVNQPYAERFGLQPADCIGKHIQEVIGESAYASFRQYIEAALAGQAVEFEIEIPYASIGNHFMRASYAPEFDERGQVVGLVAAIIDITERKRAEEKIKIANYRFRLAEEASSGFVYDWNLVTDTVERSDSLTRVLGYAPGELAPTWEAWADLLHPEDRRMTKAEAIAFLNRYPEETFRFEFRARHQVGHYCWLEERGLILRAEQGRAYRIIGQTVDINARKELEQEREHLLAEELHLRQVAEAANRSKDEFLAVVSHELRSPLNAILGYNRLLRKKPLDPAAVSQACDVIERSARLQLQLIEDLLDTARIISGKLRLDVRPIDLVPVLNDAVETMRPAVEAKGLDLLVQYGLQPEIITADAVRLLQMVINLLSNAIKFTPEDGRIELRMERDAKQVRIVVRDTGQGIAPEFLPYVFDRFRQSDTSSTRRYGGLGLGLALVKHLTELHGGQVAAASVGVGHGSTFTLTLPLAAPLELLMAEPPALAARREVRTEDALPLPAATTLAGLRLLLLDDQAEARTLLTDFLCECGALVTAVASGDEALALLAHPPDGVKPDIFISDIAMPDEDGYTVLARVRALEAAHGTAVSQQIPAIALTALAGREDRLQALTAGFQMYIAKPVEPAELVIVIATLARQWP